MSEQKIAFFNGLTPSEPLWKLAPTRDDEGKSFVDFIMLIPKLKKKPKSYIESTLGKIHMVLSQYSHVVVFADINLKINCLWISHKAQPGLCMELASAIQRQVPEALLVADAGRSPT